MLEGSPQRKLADNDTIETRYTVPSYRNYLGTSR